MIIISCTPCTVFARHVLNIGLHTSPLLILWECILVFALISKVGEAGFENKCTVNKWLVVSLHFVNHQKPSCRPLLELSSS